MKLYFNLLFCFSFFNVFSQYDVNTVGNPQTWNNSGLWVIENNVTENFEGSIYLFEEWNTIGFITTNNNETASIKGLNYDTKNDVFVTKFGKDSIFMFDDLNLKEIIINNKKFKRYNNIDGNPKHYFEIIAYSKDIEILKRYEKKIKLGKKDPLTQVSTPNKLIDSNKYYFKHADTVNEIKLNKKSFVLLFGENSNEISDFISKNKISLKEDSSFQIILNFYNIL